MPFEAPVCCGETSLDFGRSWTIRELPEKVGLPYYATALPDGSLLVGSNTGAWWSDPDSPACVPEDQTG